MFDGEFNPLRHWAWWLLAMALFAFLRLFRRWMPWPHSPDAALGRATRITLVGGVAFTALVIGIVSVNHWMIDQPFWKVWSHGNDDLIPAAMAVMFLTALLVLTYVVERMLRVFHRGYAHHVEEEARWHPRAGRD